MACRKKINGAGYLEMIDINRLWQKVFRRSLLAGAGIILLAVFLSGVLWLDLRGIRSSYAQSSTRGRIVIGAVLDITGQGAVRGREARDALVLEERRINEARGSESNHILLVTIDSAGRAEAAARGVKRLASEFRALAIVGPVKKNSALAAAQEAERAKIPLISLSAAEKILQPVRPWIFSTAHPPILAVQRTLFHIRDRGFRRAAILVSGNGFGAEGREYLSELAPEMGISILLNDQHAEDERNLLPYLQKAHIRGAEAFIHWADGPSRLALARARQALDIRLPIYMALIWAGSIDVSRPGGSLDGTVFPTSRVLAADLLPKSSPGYGLIQRFRSSFRNRYGRFPDGISGSAADALRLINSALEKGGYRRNQIREYIEKMPPTEGLTGRFRFSRNDHNGLDAKSLVMVRIEKGKWTMSSRKAKKK